MHNKYLGRPPKTHSLSHTLSLSHTHTHYLSHTHTEIFKTDCTFSWLKVKATYFRRKRSHADSDAFVQDQELMTIPDPKNAKMLISMATRLGRFSNEQDFGALGFPVALDIVMFVWQLNKK